MLPGLLAGSPRSCSFALLLVVVQARAPHGGKGGGFWWFCWSYLGRLPTVLTEERTDLQMMRLEEVEELSVQGSRLL